MPRPIRLPMLSLASFFALLAATAPAAASDLVLRPGDHVITAQVNGQPVRLRVDPEAPGYIILNPVAVRRLALRRSLTAVRFAIGGAEIRGHSKVAGVAIGGREERLRLLWSDREAISGADGLIGPAQLPYDRVVLQLRETAAGEAELRLPMDFSPPMGLFHRLTIDGQEIQFRLSTVHDRSLASAAAGALLAQRHGGSWSGERSQRMIKFGVIRPVRAMTLANPATVGGLPLSSFLVRTSDDRGSAVLPPDQVDPDEMVVTAATGRGRARYHISLAADWMSRCSSMAWHRATREMVLSCARASAG